MVFCLLGSLQFVVAGEQIDLEKIHQTVIEKARKEVPRADTASVVELSEGCFMMVYHRFRASKHGGSDFGQCSIWAQRSQDGGKNWAGTSEIVAARDDDINVQAPAISLHCAVVPRRFFVHPAQKLNSVGQ